MFSLTAKEFELLRKNYSVIQTQALGQFRARMWTNIRLIVCRLASFWISIHFYCILGTFLVYIILFLSVVFYTVLFELRLI